MSDESQEIIVCSILEPEKMLSSSKKLFKNKLAADVHFVFNERDGNGLKVEVVLPVHTLVLANNNVVFRNMLFNFRETANCKKLNPSNARRSIR